MKVGTSSVTDERGVIDVAAVGKLAAEVAALRAGGSDVIVVSSGAVAAGVAALGLDATPDRHRHAAGDRRSRPGPADAQLGRRPGAPTASSPPRRCSCPTTSSTAASTSTLGAR